METMANDASPEACAAKIHEYSDYRFEPEVASELWPAILQHKWFLSEKLGRDVGIKVACLDYIENMDSENHEIVKTERLSEVFALVRVDDSHNIQAAVLFDHLFAKQQP